MLRKVIIGPYKIMSVEYEGDVATISVIFRCTTSPALPTSFQNRETEVAIRAIVQDELPSDIVEADPRFDVRMCEYANKLFPGDNIPLIIMEVHYEHLAAKLTVFRRKNDDTRNTSRFGKSIRSTIAECAGKKIQPFIAIVCTRDDPDGTSRDLKKINY